MGSTVGRAADVTVGVSSAAKRPIDGLVPARDAFVPAMDGFVPGNPTGAESPPMSGAPSPDAVLALGLALGLDGPDDALVRRVSKAGPESSRASASCRGDRVPAAGVTGTAYPGSPSANPATGTGSAAAADGSAGGGPNGLAIRGDLRGAAAGPRRGPRGGNGTVPEACR